MRHSVTDEELKKKLDHRLKTYGSEPRLKIVNPFFNGLNSYPIQIGKNTSAHVVFYNLMKCYDQAGNVSEGVVEDLVWGLRQAGIPANITWKGLNQLKSLGYLCFDDGEGRVIIGTVSDKVWFRWTLKFLDLLVGKHEQKKPLPVDAKVNPEDIDWKDIS